MITLTDTRKNARGRLKGKWGKAAIICLCYVVIEFVLSMIENLVEDSKIVTLIFEIVQIIISVPLTYGMTISFIKLKKDEEVDGFDFINIAIQDFKKAWMITINKILKLIVPYIVAILGTALLVLGYIMIMAIFAMTTGVSFGFGVCYIILAAIFIAIYAYVYSCQLKYAASIMISYENPELTAKEAVEESGKIMVGHRRKYFTLILSFIGWAILSIFTCGIGLLWLWPYIAISELCYFDKVIEESNNKE